MNNIISAKCKYCTIPNVPIVIKRTDTGWIPFESDGITRHTHRHGDQK
ncbi:MAG TPA: hypothetical protein VIA09_02750 [Nitrososphaeraceae archaeon]